jgi:SAM-dependent methyltransferase
VTTPGPEDTYALGYTAEEHSRLVRQAALLAPCTERLFRAAGVGPGNRVLDVGSGIGDVSLLLGKIVGPAGEVVGVERDPKSVARARARIEAASLKNISFMESDIAGVDLAGTFDAVVGRFILMYLPYPAQTLRSLTKHVRPGGSIAFLEPSWAAARGLSAHLQLYSNCITAIVDTFKACGANPEMGPRMLIAFQDAGLPVPTMNVEIMLGADEEFTSAPAQFLRSLEPQANRNGVSLAKIGELDTLGERLKAEVKASGCPIAWLAAHVGAWCRLPIN